MSVKSFDKLAMANGLVLFLPLWDATKSVQATTGKDVVLDLSRYHNNGVVTGATWGIQGRTFDGVDDVITVPDHATLSALVNFTLAAWVYPTAYPAAAGDYRSIIGKDALGQREWMWGLYNDAGVQKIRAIVFDAAGGFTLGYANTTPSLNVWSHVALAYDAVNLAFYLNGVADGTTAATKVIPDKTSNVEIGADFAVSGNNWKGKQGEDRIYNRALTAGEIMHNYLSTRFRYGV